MKHLFNFIVSIFRYFFIGLWSIIIFFPKYLIYGFLVIFGKKKLLDGNYKKSFVSLIMLCLSLGVYLTGVFFLTRRFVQNERVKVLSQWITHDTEILMVDDTSNLDDGSDIESDVEEKLNYSEGASIKYADIEANKKINSDTVAWIWVNGTNIDYPVVQTDNNSYYLTHDFYKNSYYSGWVFGDYRDNFDNFGRNTIIYAHNSLNGKMFSSLTNVLNKRWFDTESNRYIKISTATSNTVWQIFSVYTIEPETYYLTAGFTDDSFKKFLKTISSRTIYNFNTDVDISDKVLTLQTCTNSGDKRIVVHAKLFRIEYR